MGRGSTDELLHVQIVDDGRTREEYPRGVRVRREGPGAMGGKEGRQDKDEPTRPHDVVGLIDNLLVYVFVCVLKKCEGRGYGKQPRKGTFRPARFWGSAATT